MVSWTEFRTRESESLRRPENREISVPCHRPPISQPEELSISTSLEFIIWKIRQDLKLEFGSGVADVHADSSIKLLKLPER